MTQPSLRSLAGPIAMPPPLAVTRVGPDDVVHIGATPIAQFPAADVTTRRHVMVQLAEAGRLPGVQIAEQFGRGS